MGGVDRMGLAPGGGTGPTNTCAPWVLFLAGLAVWPLVWVVEGAYKAGVFQSRTFVDWFAYIAAPIGFLCCVVAPFLGRITLRKKIVFALLSVAAFAVVCAACSLGFLAIFGLPKE